MSYSLQTFPTTWQRHKAKECFHDCFYCKKARKMRGSLVLKPKMIVTPDELRRER